MTPEALKAAIAEIINGQAEDEDDIGARLTRKAVELSEKGAVDLTRYSPEGAARLFLAVACAEMADNLRDIGTTLAVRDFHNLTKF